MTSSVVMSSPGRISALPRYNQSASSESRWFRVSYQDSLTTSSPSRRQAVYIGDPSRTQARSLFLKEAILRNARLLSTDGVASIIRQVARFYDPENMEEGDALPDIRSMHTLIGLMLALKCDIGDMTLTRGGNFAVTWSDSGRTLRVEALPSGNINWAHVDKRGSVAMPSRATDKSVDDLVAFLAR
jgi:hypothetical protein